MGRWRARPTASTRGCWLRSRAAIWCRRSGWPRSSCASSASARWRLFLVRKRSSLKHRVHAQLLAFGHRCPVSDLFGRQGRELLGRLDFPAPWRCGVLAAVTMIDDLDREIAAIDRELKQAGVEHAYVPLLMSVPGIAWVLAYTIASEIGDIAHFASPKKLAAIRFLRTFTPRSGTRRCASTQWGSDPASRGSAQQSRQSTPALWLAAGASTFNRERVGAGSWPARVHRGAQRRPRPEEGWTAAAVGSPR